MSKLTLISHHLCPYVQRAAIALHEKGVDFERGYVDPADKSGWFNAISPLGKVPLLIVPAADGGDDVALFESAPICEFIEETQDRPKLHPADPVLRAQRRAWVEFGSAVLADIWRLETATEPTSFATARAAVYVKFARLEQVLGTGPFFAGERFSLVDAVFGPVFRYFEVFDEIADIGLFADRPKLVAWREALAGRPSVKEAVTADYGERLTAFLRSKNAWLLGANEAQS